MSLSEKEIRDLNKMNKAAQNPALGTLLSSFETNSSGSYSGSSVYNSLVAHTTLSGSDVHRLGTISVQSASAISVSGGIISGTTLTDLNTHTGKSGSDVHNLGTISIQSASSVSITGGCAVLGNVTSSVSKFGTGGDYSSFSSDGTLTFTGSATVWDDIFFPLVTAKQGQTDKPAFDVNEIGYLFPQNDTSEFLLVLRTMSQGK